MTESAAQLSKAGARFDRLRHRAGFVLGPAVFLLIWFMPSTELSDGAHRLLAVVGLVMALWICESIPLPAMALLGPALCVVCGVAPAREAFKGFSEPVTFLFLGSFLLAAAMFRHGLDRSVDWPHRWARPRI